MARSGPPQFGVQDNDDWPADDLWESRLAPLAALLSRSKRLTFNFDADASAVCWQGFAKLAVRFRATPNTQAVCSESRFDTFGRVGLICWRSECETLLSIGESAEKYLLLLPLQGAISLRRPLDPKPSWIPPGMIGIVPALAESRCFLTAGTQLLGLVLPQTALADGLETLAGVPIAGRVVFDEGALPVHAGVGSIIHSMLGLAAEPILESGDNAILRDLEAVAAHFEQIIALSMLTGLPHSFTDVLVGQESGTVPGTVRRAEAYIRAHAGDPITLEDIAAAAGCGARALQVAFRRFRETTPLAYLRRMRLEHVYNALAYPKAGIKVTEVATAWHFPHQGRFSRLFRRVYGESPSDTLRRGRRSR